MVPLRKKPQSQPRDIVRNDEKDHQLLDLVKQLAARLDFELVDCENYWALVQKGKSQPLAVGDSRFIVRCLERLRLER